MLQRFVKVGVVIPGHLTSHDVKNLIETMTGSDKGSELREAYIRVRYGKADYTKEDVKCFKRLYKEIVKEIDTSIRNNYQR
jgi:hypothetical protein